MKKRQNRGRATINEPYSRALLLHTIGRVRGQRLRRTENLGACERRDGCDTLGVTQTDTDLGWGQALLCELVDLILHVIGCVKVLEPL